MEDYDVTAVPPGETVCMVGSIEPGQGTSDTGSDCYRLAFAGSVMITATVFGDATFNTGGCPTAKLMVGEAGVNPGANPDPGGAGHCATMTTTLLTPIDGAYVAIVNVITGEGNAVAWNYTVRITSSGP
jgi:hypothetical protein